MPELSKVSKAKQKKIEIVEKLAQKLKRAKAIVLTDYTGLTHKQLEEIRKTLKEVQAQYIVVKNTLLLKAIEAAHLELPTLNFQITGPTAVLFATGDELAPLQKLAFLVRETNLPRVKLGFFSGCFITAEEVTRLSLLPRREVLLFKLCEQIKTPLFALYQLLTANQVQLVYTLEAVRRTKS